MFVLHFMKGLGKYHDDFYQLVLVPINNVSLLDRKLVFAKFTVLQSVKEFYKKAYNTNFKF